MGAEGGAACQTVSAVGTKAWSREIGGRDGIGACLVDSLSKHFAAPLKEVTDAKDNAEDKSESIEHAKGLEEVVKVAAKTYHSECEADECADETNVSDGFS